MKNELVFEQQNSKEKLINIIDFSLIKHDKMVLKKKKYNSILIDYCNHISRLD